MLKQILNLVNELNFAKKKKRIKLVTKFSKHKIKLLKVFLKINIINFFKIKNNYIIITLNTLNLNWTIKFISTPNHLTFWNKNDYHWNLKNNQNITLICTNAGLQLSTNNINVGGGLALLKINI